MNINVLRCFVEMVGDVLIDGETFFNGENSLLVEGGAGIHRVEVNSSSYSKLLSYFLRNLNIVSTLPGEDPVLHLTLQTLHSYADGAERDDTFKTCVFENVKAFKLKYNFIIFSDDFIYTYFHQGVSLYRFLTSCGVYLMKELGMDLLNNTIFSNVVELLRKNPNRVARFTPVGLDTVVSVKLSEESLVVLLYDAPIKWGGTISREVLSHWLDFYTLWLELHVYSGNRLYSRAVSIEALELALASYLSRKGFPYTNITLSAICRLLDESDCVDTRHLLDFVTSSYF